MQYVPLKNFGTVRLTGQFDYGSGSGGAQQLPFFKNFFMTGSSSLRGFQSGKLGPKEICREPADPMYTNFTYIPQDDGSFYGVCPQKRSVGGTTRLLARAELYMPLFGLEDSDDKRFSVFMDVGNVFASSTGKYYELGKEVGAYEELSSANMRASMGLAFEWLSPIGPFGVNYALPIQQKEGDELDKFQITLGYLQN